MGILRLLLAFFVVIGHSHSIYGYAGMGGAAVPAFFIISGFYMTLILETKYRGSDQLWLFYSNRVLRLFPLYWFFVLIYFALAVVPMWRAQPPILQILVTANRSVGFALDGSIASILAIIPNAIFLGSDLLRQFIFNSETQTLSLWAVGLQETADLKIRGAFWYLLIPQSWSLSVELVFYAFVPFLVRLRTLLLIALLAGFICIQYSMLHASYRDQFHWIHLLTPYNGGYFFLGMVSYRLSRWLDCFGRGNWLFASIPIALCVAWPLVEGVSAKYGPYGHWGILMAYAIGIPALFKLSRDWALDQQLGNLSYPVYLCHMLFAWAATIYGDLAAPIAFAASCALSWIAVKFIDEPVDAWRQRRVSEARTVSSQASVADLAIDPSGSGTR